jgi:peptide/nickel transport system substrate-binding protein
LGLRVRRVLAAALIVFAVAGCSRPQGSQALEQRNQLVVAWPFEPPSLNPLLLEGTTAYAVSELLYSYLTNYDEAGNMVPDVALEVPTTANGGVSADGTRITFHLRHNVRWQDGAPLTARDVVFTYRAIMNGANNIPERFGYDKISAIQAPDPYTVVIRLKKSYAPIVPLFFGGDSNYPILPAHLLAKYPSINSVPFDEQPVGSGPYMFEKWARGDRLELVANPHYFRGKPAIARIVLPFIHDESTIINELRTGEADAAFSLDASRISLLRTLPRHRIVVTPIPYFYALGFNTQDPALRDVSIRRAIALAIDRNAVVRKVSHGLYDPKTGLRGLFTWAFDPSADDLTYNPALARKLLHGRHLRLQLAFPTGSEITTQLATVIAASEAAVGIDVTLKDYAREIYVANDGPIFSGRYQISLYDFHSNYDPDAAWLLACDQRSPHGFNEARYCNSAVDRALVSATAVYDRAQRGPMYRGIQQTVVRDVPYFFLAQASEIDVIPTALEHYERPLLSPFNSVARWRLSGAEGP